MSELNEKLLEIKNQKDTYIIPGNLKKDVTVFGITGTYDGSGGSGDVKLFETVEEMQEDENPQDGDLAVVYREEIQPVQEESEFDSCIFPNEVVLDEAFSDNVYGSFRSTGGGFFDSMVDMSSSRFRFDCYGEIGEIRVEYRSQDGITYTRTDGGDELVEFGTTIKWDDGMGSFNSIIGNFMKIGGNYFEGLYKCNEVINYGKVKPIIITDKNTISDDVNYFNIDTIKNVFDNNLENFIENCSYLTSRIKNSSAYQTDSYKALYYYWRYFVWVLNNDNTADLYCYFVNTDGYISPFVYYNDTTYLGASTNNISGTSSITLKITINLVNETMTWEDMATTVNQYKTSGNHGVLIPFNFENKKIVAYYLRPDNSNWNYTSISYNTYNATSNYISTGLTQNLTTITSHSLDYKLELIYEYANTQLGATPDYVYGKTFYGKNGVESGTLSNTISSDFNDVSGHIYRKAQVYYNTLTPIVLTDNNKNINSSLEIIPCKSDGTPLYDTSNITNMSSMFASYFTSLITIPKLNTSNVTNMYLMFGDCTSLLTISLIDTSNVTNMRGMFNGCTSLISIPQLNTSSVTNMSGMFADCSSLTTIPQLDTSSVTDMGSMFVNCASLTTVPQLNTSSVTLIYSMFNGCTSLTTIPQLDTSSVTNMNFMFYGCTSLTTIPVLNTNNVTSMNDTFNNCTSLNNDSLNNILAMCANATKITSNKTLAYIGLTQEQATICTTLSNYSAFTSAGWTTGY